MRDLLVTFLRGWLIVLLVSWNVRHVATLMYGSAFLTGGLVSLIWWGNANHAANSTVPGGRWAYSLGAAAGTVCGMWLGR